MCRLHSACGPLHGRSRGRYSARMKFLLVVAVLFSAAVSPTRAQSLSIQAAARAMQPGEVVRLTIRTTEPVTSMSVSAFDREFAPFRIDDASWQVLLGIDLDVKPGAHTVSVVTTGDSGTRSTVRTIDVKDKAFRTRRLTVEPRFVDPPASIAARIAREATRLNAIWASVTPDRLWNGVFMPPVSDPANSAFGSRSVFNNQPRSPHGGADFASPTGRPVKAPNAGRVVLADDLYFTGGTVVIDHGLGLVSLFAHLSSIDAVVGSLVATGDVVGRVGATGRVTGPHLHWTVRLAGTRVDPLALMNVTGLPASTMSNGLMP